MLHRHDNIKMHTTQTHMTNFEKYTWHIC